jgi:hypothetical protein
MPAAAATRSTTMMIVAVTAEIAFLFPNFIAKKVPKIDLRVSGRGYPSTGLRSV